MVVSCGVYVQQLPVTFCRKLRDDSPRCKLVAAPIYVFLLSVGQVINFEFFYQISVLEIVQACYL